MEDMSAFEIPCRTHTYYIVELKQKYVFSLKRARFALSVRLKFRTQKHFCWSRMIFLGEYFFLNTV